MSYTHTSIVLPCEVDAFCADCNNPLPKGSSARRRVTDTGATVFREEWICGGACGPIIDDVSDHALMRKRIAQLEEDLLHAQQELDEANQVIVMLESQRDELRAAWEGNTDTLEQLEAIRARMIEDLAAWLGEQIRAIDAVCTSDEMRRRLEDALSCLRSGSEWIR
jgi:chromosome segregation ATPase